MSHLGDVEVDVTVLRAELVEMQQRLDSLRSGRHSAHDAEVLAELETAYEELRVTTEEIEVQRDLIADLLGRAGDAQTTLDRIVRAVPLAILTTDALGLVVAANPAAARLLGAGAERLRGKPLQAYVAQDGRGRLRTAVTRAASGTPGPPVRVVLTPRVGEPVEVHLASTEPPSTDARTVLRWIAQPTGAASSDVVMGGTLQAMVELSALQVGTTDLRTLLVRLATATARGVQGAQYATMTLGDPRAPDLLASDSGPAQLADAAQLRAGEGPCVEAFRTARTTGSTDLRTDHRWPLLVPLAVAAGVVGAVGVPVEVDGTVIGVLNVYAADDRLDLDRAATQATLFAAAAGALVQDARAFDELRSEAHHLHQALTSRPVIEQAKGILMGRFGYSDDEAFQHLKQVSQNRNTKLRDVAADLVERVRASAVSAAARKAPDARP